MTYVTYLANMSGDDKSLQYAKYMRSHTKLASTLYYIDFDIKSIEGLSKILFQRGEFGYIPTLLMNKLSEGKSLNNKEIAKQVYEVNALFNEATQLNATIGLLNAIRADRESIVNLIEEKSLRECQELLTDLFTKKLPSKTDKDVQCLVSKTGCKRTDLNDCLECQYHIPSIYALNSLCKSIMSDIKLYNETKIIPNRLRLALKIHKKKFVLQEAVKRFGRDYVFGCLGYSKDAFIDLLSEIPNPTPLLK